MKHVLAITLAVAAFSSMQYVQASSFLATSDTLGASLANGVESSSDVSSSAFDDKRIVDARDEAASFVASEGNVRGAQLEEAFSWLRAQGYEHDDLVLAQAILARSH